MGRMTAEDVLEFVHMGREEQIIICLDGGWAVDALLGRQTRPHDDLDIAVEHRHVPRLRRLLEQKGYKDVPRDDTRDCNFVMGDDDGHLVDFHSYTFDEDGRLVFGLAYPPDSLNGQGMILGEPVCCITPEWLVKFHTGYPVDGNDFHDVRLLCKKFDLPIPADYNSFVQEENAGRN